MNPYSYLKAHHRAWTVCSYCTSSALNFEPFVISMKSKGVLSKTERSNQQWKDSWKVHKHVTPRYLPSLKSHVNKIQKGKQGTRGYWTIISLFSPNHLKIYIKKNKNLSSQLCLWEYIICIKKLLFPWQYEDQSVVFSIIHGIFFSEVFTLFIFSWDQLLQLRLLHTFASLPSKHILLLLNINSNQMLFSQNCKIWCYN